MRKDEYLNILSNRLSILPAEEYRDIMEYYKEYFEEAGEENEEEVIKELGEADELADRIIKENMGENVAMNGATSKTYSTNIELENDKDKLYGNENQPYSSQNGTYTQMNIPYGQNGQPYTPMSGQAYAPYPPQQQGLSTGWKVVIAIVTFPIWIGFVAAAFGLIAGFGVAALACFCSGIAVIVLGICTIATSVGTSMYFIGGGFIVLAVGFGLLIACVSISHLVGKIFDAIFGKKKKNAYI